MGKQDLLLAQNFYKNVGIIDESGTVKLTFDVCQDDTNNVTAENQFYIPESLNMTNTQIQNKVLAIWSWLLGFGY
jgi:hypothetical protein